MKSDNKRLSRGVIWGLGLVVILFVNLIPFLWGAITSLKTAREVMLYPPRFWNFTTSWEHYETVLRGSFSTAIVNSVWYCVFSIVIGILCATLAAYALTRYNMRGKKTVFYLILSMIPLSMGSAAMVVPNYMLFSILRMNDHWYTLPLIYVTYNLPMSVWIMVGGMQHVPYAIEEAAQIDGAGKGYILFRLLPRMCLPTLACAALMIFIGAWNEYTVSSVLVNSQSLYTIQVSIYNYIGYFGREWGPLTASATIAVIPILIVFSLLGKLLISGLTAGAVKE
ncbi:MAG: carbohydrate ABC transporter permease [Clostridia bacterium]|nr:carbohydrate ABC transporter permease [Clostridia bacterium]